MRGGIGHLFLQSLFSPEPVSKLFIVIMVIVRIEAIIRKLIGCDQCAT